MSSSPYELLATDVQTGKYYKRMSSMTNVENKVTTSYFFEGFWNRRKWHVSGMCFAALFLLTTIVIVTPMISIHPASTTHAATTNTAEDNFQRADTAVGWGTTTNADGLTNYAWQRSLSNTTDAYIHTNTGTIVYAGINGHKVAGYVGVPPQQGGDALAEITFTAVGHGEGGLCLQVTGGTDWYQGDMNTSTGTLEIRKRLNGIMTTEAFVPVAYVANTAYWLRLDVQPGSGSEQVNLRMWAAGTTEPSSWQVTWTDNTPLPAGAAGAMGDWFKSPSPGEQVIFQSWSYAATGFAVPAMPVVTNTAEDNFQRADTAVGWGTTTNNDGLTNYAWQRSLSNTTYGYIHSNTGTIVYAGINGHKVAGYVGVPPQQGGDALAEITFTAVGHGVGGLCLQVTGGTAWYQGDMNTSTGTLEIRKRLNGIMTTEAFVPVAYVANTAYWLRLDVQAGSGSEQVNLRMWAAGTTEPSTWQVTWTDNSPLPAGAAGAMGDWFSSPSPGEQVIFQSWSYDATGFATPAH
jgi:hypothetical protein